MNTQMEIRQKLLEGKQPLDLIAEGYSRSSVYFELRKIRSQLPVSAPDSELAEQDRREEVLKPEEETAYIKTSDEELKERVATLEREVLVLRSTIRNSVNTTEELKERAVALEREVLALRSVIRNSVNTALLVMLRYLVDEKAAREYAQGWVERNIENLIDKPREV